MMTEVAGETTMQCLGACVKHDGVWCERWSEHELAAGVGVRACSCLAVAVTARMHSRLETAGGAIQ